MPSDTKRMHPPRLTGRIFYTGAVERLHAMRFFLQQLLKRRPWLPYTLIFLWALAFYATLQSSPTFLDPDAFYHIKMAILMRESGIMREFTALPFTLFGAPFADHHFLYHVLLIPFVTFFPPALGAKLATALLASSVILVFYALLKKYRVPFPWVFAALLAVCHPFMLRINLVKTSGLSVIFLFAALYFLFQKKHLPIFLLSFVYVWMHGGWPLMLVFLFAFLAASFAERFLREGRISKNDPLVKDNLRAFFSVVGGLAAGLVINPYFPNNLAFYREQIFRIAVTGARNTIGVGSEWYPYAFHEILSVAPVAILLLVLGLLGGAILAARRRFLSPKTPLRECLTLALLSIFFFALLFKSKRHIEYFTPVSFLFGATAIASLHHEKILRAKDFFQLLPARINRHFLIPLLFFPAAGLLFTLVARDALVTKQLFETGYGVRQFSKTGAWLREHANAGDVVFHDNWDQFPALFYEASDVRYIIGLDPTFLYDNDTGLYWDWYRISKGEQKNIFATVKNDFSARWMYVNSSNQALQDILDADPRFQKMFESEEGTLYELSL